jgi:glutathione peroxidase-family protein
MAPDHHTQLAAMYREKAKDGLEVLAFPSDTFKQSPGDSCSLEASRIQLPFPLYQKVEK